MTHMVKSIRQLLQWQLETQLVQKELTALCARYGHVTDVFISPYVDSPKENKIRNAS